MSTRKLARCAFCISLIVLSLIVFGCRKDRNNPLDPESMTDPFELSAELTSGGAELTWHNPGHPNIQGYNIYRSDDNLVSFAKIGTTDRFRLTYLDTELGEGNIAYYYRITAVGTGEKESLPSFPKVLFVPAVNQWVPVGGNSGDEDYGGVFALASYRGQLYVGGNFWAVGDGVYASILASWDGTNWSTFDISGAWVDKMFIYHDLLLVGGYFDAGGIVVEGGIATWDGKAWSELGNPPLNGEVNALAIYSPECCAGDLIAAGRLLNEDQQPRGMYIFNGNYGNYLPESPLGSKALAVFGNKLIVAVNGIDSSYIIPWAGFLGNDDWVPKRPGIFGRINSLVVYGEKLFVGGNFSSAGGIPANNIVAWDGVTWSPLGQGINGAIYVFTICNDKLIVGGSFTQAGGVSANNIAAWDGLEWSPLGPGMNAWVEALTVFNGQLIAGGGFTQAGAYQVSGLASWYELPK